MNLKELRWPVRIYWDLPQAPSQPVDYRSICREIIEIKILFLGLRDASSTLGSSCLDILNLLKGKNIAVSLTISDSAASPSLFAGLTDLPVKTLLVDASSLGRVRALVDKIRQYENAGLFSGVSFNIGKDNFREIPDLVSFCINSGIRELVFPIQRLAAGNDYFCINKDERKKLSLKLSGLDCQKTRITIHDPFLWQVFYPGADYHEGGCQAANSMLYISPDYRVYPCPAMAIELGSLHKTTLKEIILSERKKELRRSILSLPEECSGCGEADKCLAGCRGRALAAFGTLNRLDPACK